MSAGLLIAGGYGEVGFRIAAELARAYPGRVIVAGRNVVRAMAAADALGSGVRGRQIDVHDEASIAAALDGVSLAVSCIDQPERHLVNAAIERGLAYTDITPHLTTLGGERALDQLHARARSTGARIVLGTGLAPGISSVLARACVERLGRAESLDTAVLLGAGDAFGPASLRYLLLEVLEPSAFASPRRFAFPAPFGNRTAYLFPFSDSVFYPRTLGVTSARSHLALEPAWLGPAVAAALRLGGRALLQHGAVREALAALVERLHRLHRGTDGFGLVVEARKGDKTAQIALGGGVQAQATALGAALIARALYDGEVAPGAWLAEQVITPTPFLERLADHGFAIQVNTACEPRVCNNKERTWPQGN